MLGAMMGMDGSALIVPSHYNRLEYQYIIAIYPHFHKCQHIQYRHNPQTMINTIKKPLPPPP